MLDVAILQLRIVTSQVFGKRIDLKALEGLLKQTVETQKEFGSLGNEELARSSLDPETAKSVHFNRFKQMAVIAGRETPYYSKLFTDRGINPTTIKKITDIPTTPKEVLRDFPSLFVRKTINPVFRSTSTGTTGRPTSVFQSNYEVMTHCVEGALGMLLNGRVLPEDILMNCNNSRAYYGNDNLVRACHLIGAICFVSGQIGASETIDYLMEKFNLAGKKNQISVIHTYPSYLGEVVEYGLKKGYKPSDFGLERIMIGGGITTQGLRDRTKKLFGDYIRFFEGYSMIEIGPLCGTKCNQGHVHYEAEQGIIEVQKMESNKPAKPGEVGRLVATPLPPYRETTIVLRYNTLDIAKPVAGPFTCSLKQAPTATSNILGRFKHCVKHEKGWTTTRDVAEALESIEEITLPARYGFWKAKGKGVEVEVMLPKSSAKIKRKIISNLEKNAVPVSRLHVVDDKNKLKKPIPLRCDLKDFTYDKGVR